MYSDLSRLVFWMIFLCVSLVLVGINTYFNMYDHMEELQNKSIYYEGDVLMNKNQKEAY